MTVKYVIQFKRQHSSIWESKNPTLAVGEPGFETNTNKLKIGDGITPWNVLDYLAPDEADGLVYTHDVGSVSTTMIAADAVTAQKIAPLAINDSHVADNAEIDVEKLSGVVSQTNGTVTTASTSSSVVRNITVSTSAPTGGNDGDVWLVYLP